MRTPKGTLGYCMFLRLGSKVAHWCDNTKPWTDVYGVARSVLAISSILTLTTSSWYTLFRPRMDEVAYPMCHGAGEWGIFCIVSWSDLRIPMWLCVVALLVIGSGWRPRWTCVPHWWIAWSCFNNFSIQDGGESVAAVLTLLLIPIALTDPRKWCWERLSTTPSRSRQLIALTLMLMIRLQVSVIYGHAASSKLNVTEWADGTALYYWLLTEPQFAPGGIIHDALRVLLLSPVVAVVTWGALLIEFVLMMGLFASTRVKRSLLVVGLLFHAGILFLMGIASFATYMFAAVILYLRPFDHEFGVRRVTSAAWSLLARATTARRWSLRRAIASTHLGQRE